MAKHAAFLRSYNLAEGVATRASELASPQEEARFVSLELVELKSLFPNGLKPGTITQLEGARSTGRTSIATYILAQATGLGQTCAAIDAQSNLHPESLRVAGVRLEHLLWIRCQGNPDHAMRAADLLLHAGGFGIIWLDLCEVLPSAIQRIPLSYWYRFRRAIENTATSLLVSADIHCAKSSVSNNLQLTAKVLDWPESSSLFKRVQISASSQKNAERHSLILHAVV